MSDMTTTQEQATCDALVSDGMRFPHFHRCGKPIKRDGLCGVHAAAKERRAASMERGRKEREAFARALNASEKAQAELAELGVATRRHADAEGYYTCGLVIDDPQALLNLIKTLRVMS